MIREVVIVAGAGISVSPVIDPVTGTLTVTVTNSSPGAANLVGDANGPVGATLVTGVHNVVNHQAATTAVIIGSAGGAAMLPVTPRGYVNWTVNGLGVMIPFYNPSGS
jgi:hypothetical protein